MIALCELRRLVIEQGAGSDPFFTHNAMLGTPVVTASLACFFGNDGFVFMVYFGCRNGMAVIFIAVGDPAYSRQRSKQQDRLPRPEARWTGARR